MAKRWMLDKLLHLVGDNQLKRDQIKVFQAYQNCFTGADGKLTEDGETVIRNLFQYGNIENTTQVNERNSFKVDKDAMLINEGRRQLALHILACIKLDILTFGDIDGRQSSSTDTEHYGF